MHPSGFAFVDRGEGETSIFVPKGSLGGAMDGDEVLVASWLGKKGPEGRVRSVVHRHRTRLTGVVRRAAKNVSLEPDDPRILGRVALLGEVPKTAEGMLVVAAIVDYPDPWNDAFTATLERVLGRPGELTTEIEKVLVEAGVDPVFAPEVLAEAETVPDRVLPKDLERRADLRALDFMTIDPKDARDFDDAVCVEVFGKGSHGSATMRVHVAVADVSHYVRPGSAIDREATLRAFSTYLPNRAIPMLPERLSSGICSLVPGKDRLAMVVSLDVDPEGRVGATEVRAAVIHSRMRLTYEQVAAELGGAGRLAPKVRARITTLREAADRLRRPRLKRGAVELNLPETKVILDEDDPERVRDIRQSRADPEVARAYNLIEEFMLAANDQVAKLAAKAKLSVLYRVHDRPEESRIDRFCAAADLFGIAVDPAKLATPRGMQRLIQAVAKHERREILNMLLLRTMAQAEYSASNLGHFALASPAYLHFTSPIRRYADLVCHRAVKGYLGQHRKPSGPPPFPAPLSPKETQELAARCSDRERVCAGAERDVKQLFAAVHMRDRIGDRLTGTVTGLSHGAAYVSLDEPRVDGVLRRAGLERQTRQTYELDALGIRLVAAKSQHTLSLGDRVVVEIVDSNPARRQIELALVARA